jgi:hypothetical protein
MASTLAVISVFSPTGNADVGDQIDPTEIIALRVLSSAYQCDIRIAP